MAKNKTNTMPPRVFWAPALIGGAICFLFAMVGLGAKIHARKQARADQLDSARYAWTVLAVAAGKENEITDLDTKITLPAAKMGQYLMELHRTGKSLDDIIRLSRKINPVIRDIQDQNQRTATTKDLLALWHENADEEYVGLLANYWWQRLASNDASMGNLRAIFNGETKEININTNIPLEWPRNFGRWVILAIQLAAGFVYVLVRGVNNVFGDDGPEWYEDIRWFQFPWRKLWPYPSLLVVMPGALPAFALAGFITISFVWFPNTVSTRLEWRKKVRQPPSISLDSSLDASRDLLESLQRRVAK